MRHVVEVLVQTGLRVNADHSGNDNAGDLALIWTRTRDKTKQRCKTYNTTRNQNNRLNYFLKKYRTIKQKNTQELDKDINLHGIGQKSRTQANTELKSRALICCWGSKRRGATTTHRTTLKSHTECEYPELVGKVKVEHQISSESRIADRGTQFCSLGG